MEHLESERKLTRSKVLKRAGVGAAALWAAPFVSSSSAYAGVMAKTNICTAPDDNVDGIGGSCGNACGPGVYVCNGGSTCGCGFTAQKCCQCVAIDETFSCSSQPCNKNRDCPSGFTCVLAACCENVAKGICVHTCPNPGAAGVGSARGGVVAKLG